jgi:hypothetical protein
MQLLLPNAHANITDEYTGVVTTGGAVTLSSANPFTDSTGRAYGQYMDVDITSIDYCYAYLNFTQPQGRQFILSKLMVVDFAFRALQFPNNSFDIMMIRTTASMVGVIFLRFMQGTGGWFIRVYACQNDGSFVSADTPILSAAAWQAEQWTFVLTIVPKNGSNTGTVTFEGMQLCHSSDGVYARISSVNNDVMMNYPTSITMGSPSATAAVAQYDIDEVAIQDFAYVARIQDPSMSPMGRGAGQSAAPAGGTPFFTSRQWGLNWQF